jgi:hypothetical protein
VNNRTSGLSDAFERTRPRRPRRPTIGLPSAAMDQPHDDVMRSEGRSMTACDVRKDFKCANFKNSMLRGIQIARAMLLAVGLVAAGTSAHAAPVSFAKLFNPIGVETDRAGNVYVDSDAVFTTVLTKFSAAGAPLAQASIGGLTVGNTGHIARIPNSDSMVLLTSLGQILTFTTNDKPSLFLDLSWLNFAIATALDVTLNSSHQFTLGLPTWGDIAAVWARPNLIYFYLTATTNASGSFPFVLRLAFDLTTNVVTPTVVATSTATTAGVFNEPRGIAVNSLGWVLTGFPFTIPNRGFADSLVAFTTSFPEVSNGASRPRFILPNPNTLGGISDMASVGMSTDTAGDFYIATGPVGSSLCGRNGSGALVLVSSVPIRPTLRCANLPAILASSNDVAVSPVKNIPYMTVQSQVVRFDPLVPANATAVQRATESPGANLGLAHRHLTLEPLR